MSDQDRLAEIKARRVQDWITAATAEDHGIAEFIAHAPDDIDWLLGEVSDRRTDLAMALTQLKNTIGEVERLRGRLRELEWPQPIPGGSLGPGIHCPICGNVREQGHEPDCWLAKELRST